MHSDNIICLKGNNKLPSDGDFVAFYNMEANGYMHMESAGIK